VPYGVYDIADNVGWVSIGTDHDTASFAVNAIRRWWRTMGKKRYPKATRLMISDDGGGSNGYRVRLWKVELQNLVYELKFPVTVCHLPPGTSKWNKIEHPLFSFNKCRNQPILLEKPTSIAVARGQDKADEDSNNSRRDQHPILHLDPQNREVSD
jgi:hypothetical protein